MSGGRFLWADEKLASVQVSRCFMNGAFCGLRFMGSRVILLEVKWFLVFYYNVYTVLSDIFLAVTC